MREDIEIYATALMRRYRDHALGYVLTHAGKLNDCGDHDGYRVWMSMADMIHALSSKEQEALGSNDHPMRLSA